jgi:acetyltransferase-like isoleucine patch superfamily enzyme
MKFLRYIAPLIPLGGLRNWLHVRSGHAKLERGASIGFLSFINGPTIALAEGASIGRSCIFSGPMRVSVGKGTRIGNRNRFECGTWTDMPRFQEAGYRQEILIGEDVLITDNHHFDGCGRISIGGRTWVAGTGSQFWTHGVGVQERDVTIGTACYIGSAARISPGTKLGARNIVAIGSVVSGDHSAVTGMILGGVPARVIGPVGPCHDFSGQTTGAGPLAQPPRG